jgi:hypothetical protein
MPHKEKEISKNRNILASVGMPYIEKNPAVWACDVRRTYRLD